MKVFRYAIVPFCAALCAALLAHVAIDVLGDYVLAHDAYDDVAHGSRALVASGALALAFVAAFGALRALVRSSRGSEGVFCTRLRAALPRSAIGFAGFASAVTAGAFVVLAAMEAVDAALAGATIDDPADLVGGSFAFAGAITLAAGLAVSLLVAFALRRLAASPSTIARALAAFARRSPAPCAAPGSLVRRAAAVRRLRTFARTARIAGRAPPLSAR